MIDFFCPECSGETHTIESRSTLAGHRRRRKQCLLDPTHPRFSTIEITYEEYELLCAYRRLLTPAITNFTKETHDRITEQQA